MDDKNLKNASGKFKKVLDNLSNEQLAEAAKRATALGKQDEHETKELRYRMREKIIAGCFWIVIFICVSGMIVGFIYTIVNP